MAKRFTETDKWKKEWYRKLGSKWRDIWTFLLDNCDNAGIWDIDIDALKFYTGASIDLSELLQKFEDRLEVGLNNKLKIIPFIEFQYGKVLSQSNNAHRSALSKLDKYQGLPRGCPGAPSGPQDKDKDKDMDMDQEKDKERRRKKETKKDTAKEDADALFAQIYKAYPRREGRKAGRRVFNSIEDAEKYKQLVVAVNNYAQLIAQQKTEMKYVKQFSTFMNNWEDYIEKPDSDSDLFAKRMESGGILLPGTPAYKKFVEESWISSQEADRKARSSWDPEFAHYAEVLQNGNAV